MEHSTSSSTSSYLRQKTGGQHVCAGLCRCSVCTCVGVTLRFLRLKHSEQTCREEAKLSLTGVGQRGDHLSH